VRPVRFVALSEDGHALVLADEVGRLLALPIDDRIAGAMHPEQPRTGPVTGSEPPPSLAPRDIQARIRAGESAQDVARAAGVPVERVLRFAGPVLQERAMLAQHARRTRLRTSEKGALLGEVVDARLSQHGIELDKISWDAYRRDDGTWRIVAAWPSGKATATAMWELDKARQVVSPQDDMAHYLCGERSTQLSMHDMGKGHEINPTTGTARSHLAPRPGHEPIRPPAETLRRDPPRPGRDPIRAGREALLASLERPLGQTVGTCSLDVPTPVSPAAVEQPRRRPATYDDDRDPGHLVPAVPSLAVLRPRRTGPAADADPGEKPRKRSPSWDDVLFGGGPEARDA
jgi:Protein of unknown function (DUF3071)